MTPAFMPFTYLSMATADTLAALVGPFVVYQPMATGVSESLATLVERGAIAIRVPLSGDEDRLAAALDEFTQWARMNPGKSTAGAGFISSRQGVVPFFDETTINQIRTDIHQHGRPAAVSDAGETSFSARLFLAVAQDNDRTTDHLDDDLSRFKAVEQKFLDSLDGADEVAFDRHGTGADLWREDPGARQTIQRVRAWCTLAAADADPPNLLVTTSPTVVDTLMESFGDALSLETLATIRLGVPLAGDGPLLASLLADLAARLQLASGDLEPFSALDEPAAGETAVTVTLLAARDHDPANAIRAMAPLGIPRLEKKGAAQPVRHTLILLVQK